MSNQNVTFTAWLKDQMSGPLDKMSRHGNAAFDKLRSGIAKFQGDGKKASLTIEQIDKNLKQLNARRITLHIDSKEFKRVSHEIDALELKKRRLGVAGGTGMGMFSKLGLYGMAIGAAYKGIQFFKSSLTEYDKSEKVTAQLQAGLKSTGGVSGKTMGGMSAQAENLQKVTLFDDETTKNAQAILLTFTKIRDDVFDQTIPLIPYMETRLGTDLNTAALQVGKALNDPIQGVTALRRVGVQLNDHQKQQVKTFMDLGQVSKAQAIILKELETEFGGSARAAAKAGTGGLTILKNKMGDLKETIGQGLSPVLLSMGKDLGRIVDSAKKYMEVPLSQEMQKQKIQVDGLVMALMDHNITADERNRLYNDLIRIAPEFEGVLVDEKLNYDELNKRLFKYNELMDKRISSQRFDENTQKLVDRETEINDLIFQRRQNIADAIEGAKQLGILNSQYFKSTEENLKSGRTNYLEYAEAMYKFIDAAYATTKNSQLRSYKYMLWTGLYGSGQKDLFSSADTKNSIWGLYNLQNEEHKKVVKRLSEAYKTKQSLGLTDLDYNKSGNNDPTKDLDSDLKTINGDISKVKNINITIQRIVGIENNTIENASGGEINLSRLEGAISEILLTEINDANLAGGND